MEVMILLTVVVLAVILYLIRRGGVAAALTVEVPKWVGSLVVGIGMAVPFLGVGIGMVCMGFDGRSPAGTMRPGEAHCLSLFGVAFAFGGIYAAIRVIWEGRLAPKVQRFVNSLFLVFLGVPIIATGLLDRASIRTSIFDLPVHGPVGSSAGAVGFLVAGLLCLVGAFWPWRWWK
jgi:hypothetical protein